MKRNILILTAIFFMTVSQVTGQINNESNNNMDQKGFYNLKATSIEGEEIWMHNYRGKVIIVVNTASECGFTPQFEGLEKLYQKYKDRGLVILGFPCNQFGKQEPGTASEIREFCQANYGVTFDMFSKIDVNGDQATDLYKFLKAQDTQPKGAGDVRWNFEKFILDQDGNLIARFGSRVKPDSDEFMAVVKKAIGE